MSRVRATHNGPALLRKLKLAQESGSTASYLSEDGHGLLDKASKLRGFVKQQRQRTDSSSAKSSWMTMQMQLQAEDKALEGEVAALIMKAISSGVPDGSQELLDVQAEMQAAAEGILQLQNELQDSVSQLASAVHCLRMYSPEQSQPELAAMQQELQPARQGLDLAMAQLARYVLFCCVRCQTINHHERGRYLLPALQNCCSCVSSLHVRAQALMTLIVQVFLHLMSNFSLSRATCSTPCLLLAYFQLWGLSPSEFHFASGR